MKFISLLLITFLFPSMVFAATTPVNPVVEVTPEATAEAQVMKYDLPYPGMLPNNPLYALKQARDWILDKLISDPVKKTEFYILQGDKRLAMGMELTAAGNGVLAEQTISKGEKYMNNAMATLLTLKTQGNDIPANITDHLTQALAKHEDVLETEIAKTKDTTIKSGLTGSLNLVNTLRSELPKLK